MFRRVVASGSCSYGMVRCALITNVYLRLSIAFTLSLAFDILGLLIREAILWRYD